MSKTSRRIIIALLFVAVVVPACPLVLWSFTQLWTYDQVLPDFTTQVWEKVFANSQITTALVNSLILSAEVVVLSLILSFFAAKNLGTKNFRGKRALQLLLLVPSFLPQIALVFGIQKEFSQIGLYNNYAGVVVALLVFYVPYMTLLLSAVFEAYDTDYEDQARTLGIGRIWVLLRVTLPQVRSGVIVACIFSFIGTWSAYLVISSVASPSFKTMPVILFPMINSASNGYATSAAATILYILPIMVVLLIFSKAFVNDTKTASRGQLGNEHSAD